MKKDILDLNDVRLLVNSFYMKVREDDWLAPLFNPVIQDRWPAHLELMVTFWQTILLDEHTYVGSPFVSHVNLPLENRHFVRWLELFNQTLDEHFEGEKAEEARWRAAKMAEMFQNKLAVYRTSGAKPVI